MKSQYKLRFFNVVIHPASKHNIQFYIDLFNKIFDQSKTYKTGSGKKTKIRMLSMQQDLIQGTLINYTTLDSDNWYDDVSDQVITHHVDPNIYPNAKEWDFFFYPEKHRMAIIVKKGISWPQIENYFKQAFVDVCDCLGFDEVRFTQETSQEGIDEIFALDAIDSLEVEISYSNNDINDITADAIDQEFKKSNISTIKTKAVGSKGHPITFIDKYLGSLIQLAKHNGFAKASGTFGNKKKIVNTKDYPKTLKINQVSSNNIFRLIKDAIISIL